MMKLDIWWGIFIFLVLSGASPVRLFYGVEPNISRQAQEAEIFQKLIENGIDTSRVLLYYDKHSYGALQDPGPIFLRNSKGQLALTDFRFHHPHPSVDSIDKRVAKALGVPTVPSAMFSEGGGWQTNGKGTMLLVESVELDRNPDMSREQIAAEYKRVLGVKKIIWLKKGAKEEEWGKLENGIYGIGTGGHIDEFCRFADEHTIILAEVSQQESMQNEILQESRRRMEESYGILSNSTDQDGKPFRILRIPAGPMMTSKVAYQTLNRMEKSWFDHVTQDSVTFYLTTGYLNFVIANKVVVTSGYWRAGMPETLRVRDEQARAVLAKAFPGRRIVQIDCMSVHYDGAGLHCYSRNEPKGSLR